MDFSRIEAVVPGRSSLLVGREPLSPEVMGPQTLEATNVRLLGLRLREAIDAGQVTTLDVTQNWRDEPWRAMPFLRSQLGASPMLSTLQEWGQQAGAPDAVQHPERLQTWLALNQERVAPLQARWNELLTELNRYLDTQRSTITHLRSQRAGKPSNWIDGVWKDLRESVNFQRDPALSAGIVVGGAMLGLWLWRSKSRAAKFTRFAAGTTVLLTFLRHRYGIQVTEDLLARPLEQWGAPKAAEWLRNMRDTMLAPFAGKEGRGSAVALLHRRIGLNGREEELMFSGISTMSPQRFVAAYEAARRISQGPAGTPVQLPPEVRDLITEFQRNRGLSGTVRGLSDQEKLDAFLRVADKVLGVLPSGSNRDQALAFIRDRYVTGAFQQRLVAEASVTRRPGGDVRVDAVTDAEFQGLALLPAAVRTANQPGGLTMLDLLLVHGMREEDWQRVGTFTPNGAAARDLMHDAEQAARDGWSFVLRNGQRVVTFVTDDIPRFLRDEAWPRIQPQLEGAWNQLQSAGVWTGDQAGKIYRFALDTPVGQILKEAVGAGADAVGGGFEMTGEQAKRLGVWLGWKRLEAGGTSFADMDRFEKGDASTAQPGITQQLNEGRTSFPIRSATEAKIWRALHDKGIIQLENRGELGIDTDPVPTAEARLSASEAAKLKEWLRLWRAIFTSATAPATTPTTPAPAPTVTSGPVIVVPPTTVPTPPVVVPVISESSFDFRLREIDAVDLGGGTNGLFAKKFLDGNYRIGFRTPVAGSEEYFTGPITPNELVTKTLPELVRMWRAGVPVRLKERLQLADRVHSGWDVRFGDRDNILYKPLGATVTSTTGGSRPAPTAETPLHILVRQRPERIVQAYNAFADTARTDRGDPFTIVRPD
jgi:hypothetical protein